MNAVRQILDGRIVDIETDQDATKAEKKERRRLVSAGKKLLKYEGDAAKGSLKKAALAVKFISKARSLQEDVSGCVDDLLFDRPNTDLGFVESGQECVADVDDARNPFLDLTVASNQFIDPNLVGIGLATG